MADLSNEGSAIGLLSNMSLRVIVRSLLIKTP
jgi:hypothetical protein